MKEKKQDTKDGQPRQNAADNKSKKVTSSGVTQPHQAKKEALGPDTNR